MTLGRALSQIDQALHDPDVRKMDRMVRRVLRWMMGPGHMRGAPELYGNCSLAKAWWCGHLASLIADELGEDNTEDDYSKMLAATEALKNIWLEFADYIAGKLTVVGEQNVLGGITLWAVHYLNNYPAAENRDKIPEDLHSKIPRPTVRKVVTSLGELSSWCVLGVKSPSEILENINARVSMDQESSS